MECSHGNPQWLHVMLGILWPFGQTQVHSHSLIATHHAEGDLVAHLRLGIKVVGKVLYSLEPGAVDGGDDVAPADNPNVPHTYLPLASPQPGPGRRGALGHLGQEHTLAHRKLQGRGEGRRYGLAGDPEIGMAGPALGDKLRDPSFDGIHRNGEADAHIASTRAKDSAVDTDDLPGRVQQGAAGVARVYGGVGLDKPSDDAAGARARVPAPGADHP